MPGTPSWQKAKSKAALLGVTINEKISRSTSPEINTQIRARAEKFESVRGRLRILIAAMKAQHASMRDVNQRMLEVSLQPLRACLTIWGQPPLCKPEKH